MRAALVVLAGLLGGCAVMRFPPDDKPRAHGSRVTVVLCFLARCEIAAPPSSEAAGPP